MKWPLDQIKSALREKTERRSVKDLVQSGARSVRVISEDTVFQLIQAVVNDALDERSESADAGERERIAKQAKQRLEQVLRQNTLAEHRSRRQQETILAVQRQVERLERERGALLEKARDQGDREAEARRLADEAARDLAAARDELEAARHELDALRRERDEAREQAEAAELEADESSAAREALGSVQVGLLELKRSLAALTERRADDLDAERLDALVSRLADRETQTAASLEERFARSMDQVLERVGRTIQAATARPVDRPVEATEALLGKVFDHESEMESNIGELGVAERASRRSIARSLERLRAARSAASAEPSPVTETSDGTGPPTAERRRRQRDRREGAASSRPAATERRKGARDRRRGGGKGGSRRKS